MTAKHTPGPWTVGDPPYGHTEIEGGDPPYLLAVATRYWGQEVAHANARLIAAAPDLLEALQAYDAWADKTPPADKELKALREQMRAAIAKATGGQP